MTHFLWVEDFNASETKRPENIVSSTVNSVFGSLLDSKELIKELAQEDVKDARDFLEENGIFLKRNLLEALEFIRNPQELAKVDFIILDVDMPLKGDKQKDINNYITSLIELLKQELIEKYKKDNIKKTDDELEQEARDNLERTAGYQIYIDLVIELNFPKKHILFCSNHANYFEQLKQKFINANIKPPVSPNPNKPFLEKEDKEFIEKWLIDKRSDYFVLRRGIIEGCKKLKDLLDKKEATISFNNWLPSDNRVNADEINDYLNILENFLPLRKPDDEKVLYKLFIRTLSHEWEAVDPKKVTITGLPWIMKNVRNWITHNSTLFNELNEQMVAYLFLVNMRIILNFDSNIQRYENVLLQLFNENALEENIFTSQIKNQLLPVSKVYLDLKNIVLNERQDKTKKVQDGFHFNELANNLQQSNSTVKNDQQLFYKLLYQMFWLTTSNPFISTGNRKNLLEIKFWNFDYGKKDDYLFELARHIYNRSFL